jgi:hypothetical protein
MLGVEIDGVCLRESEEEMDGARPRLPKPERDCRCSAIDGGRRGRGMTLFTEADFSRQSCLCRVVP